MGFVSGVLAVSAGSSAFVVLVGRANARTRPRTGDSPYRLPSGSLIAYILCAALALFCAAVVVALAIGAVRAVAGA